MSRAFSEHRTYPDKNMTITPGMSSAVHQIHLQDETKILTVIGTNFQDWQDSEGVRQNLSQKQPML